MDDQGQQKSQKRYPPFLKNSSGERSLRFPAVSRSFVPSVFTVMNMVSMFTKFLQLIQVKGVLLVVGLVKLIGKINNSSVANAASPPMPI